MYAADEGFWAQAPMRPDADTYFDEDATYSRPGAAYLARDGRSGWPGSSGALRDLQQRYGGASVTREQWQAAFEAQLPVRAPAC